ncbi:MAG TPA: HIT family protein [Hellea balneolensis]|uniref:HIT family protein n=1 Tax=Hellea balneolensis TaxID=287478 RepID=A0A7C5R7G6_9PROT|nr:HIT family protein [Hellea balneolensis]
MSRDAQYDTDNIFAKIVRGEMPCVKVFENDKTLAFMDVFPQSKGHVLVIHKTERAVNILDVSDAGLAQIMKTVKTIAKAVRSALSPDGIVITQFNGAPAGQTVFHLHVHIIPRYEGEHLSGHNHGQMADMDELAKIAEQLQSRL